MNPYARTYKQRPVRDRQIRDALDKSDPCPDINIHCAYTAVDLDGEDKPLKWKAAIRGPDKEKWEKANVEEWERLLDTSKTLKFIHHDEKPGDRLASYYNPQVKKKIDPAGVEKFRVRGTYGGDRTDWDGPRSALTASMTTVKLNLNATISEGAKWMTADIVDYYLGTPLLKKEYMRVNIKYIPEKVLVKYEGLIKDGYVMSEISKGIYGLPQAGLLAQERLVRHLAKNGYHQAKNTPCLFSHEEKKIVFTLVVDDFGIKYQDKADAEHLLAVLRQLGLWIDIDRDKKTLTLSMPGYVNKAMKRFGHDSSRGSEVPIKYTPPNYGKHTQMAQEDGSPKLSPGEAKRIQEIVGVFQYYARVIDSTMLCATTKLASAQANPTKDTQAAADMLLDYAEKHQDAKVVFKASSMQYRIHSDASYQSESGSRSRAGGIHYLGEDSSMTDTTPPNGAILCVSTIIDVVCSSAFEAEYAGLFINGTTSQSIRATLEDLGYPQEATEIVTDNLTTYGIINGTAKQKRSKAVDMRFNLRISLRRHILRHIFRRWYQNTLYMANYEK